MGDTGRIGILYVQPTSVRGGIETALLTIIRGLDRQKFEPHVVFLEHGDLVREMRQAGGLVSVFPTTRLRYPGNTAATILRLAWYIHQRHISVVHCNGPKSQIYGALAALLGGVPSVLWLHNIPDTHLGKDLMADVAFLLPSSRLLTNSAATNQAAINHPFIRKTPRVLWYGIDLTYFQRIAPAIKAEPSVADGDKHIVLLGRIQSWKGQHVLIEAVPLVRARRHDVRFHIVGSPSQGTDLPYYHALLDRVHDLGLDDVVEFAPQTTDTSPWYTRADIVVNASIPGEAFGLVVIEALACGRPVVATNTGGALDSMDGGKVGGLLVPPDDAPALAEALIYLLDHPGEAAALAEAGRERVLRLYSADRMVADLQALYEQIAR